MHATLPDLQALLPALRLAPADDGEVALLCVRPRKDERVELDEALLTPAEGMVGDRWAGKHPDTQLTLMATRAIQAVAGPRERWSLAGDQVFVDMDLSEENLPAGTRLSLGEAEIEITAEPHLGCSKFAARYGQDAMRFVCAKDLRNLRLRGVYARVLKPGRVRLGDRLRKLVPEIG